MGQEQRVSMKDKKKKVKSLVQNVKIHMALKKYLYNFQEKFR